MGRTKTCLHKVLHFLATSHLCATNRIDHLCSNAGLAHMAQDLCDAIGRHMEVIPVCGPVSLEYLPSTRGSSIDGIWRGHSTARTAPPPRRSSKGGCDVPFGSRILGRQRIPDVTHA